MAHTRFHSRRWAFALAILAFVGMPARAGFTIANLGAIPISGTSGATAINASGVAAGKVNVPSGPESGTYAASSAGGTLQSVSVPSGATWSAGTAINSSGAVAGNFSTSTVTSEGFYSPSGGAAVPVGFLSVGNATGTSSQVTGINDGGEVVGTGNVPGGASNRAFFDQGGKLTMIAPLGGGDPSSSSLQNWANGVNSTGTVVGTSELSAGGVQKAFYTDASGNPVSLTTRNSGSSNFSGYTAGLAIANDGDIVGAGSVGSATHAFFAPDSGGPLIDLGTLGSSNYSEALAVNDHALVVGTSGGRAFLWSPSEGMYDLNSLIPAADQGNWVLTEATGINDLGQITGEGLFDGVLEGFVLTPIPGQSPFDPPGQVPTPPALVLSAVGLAIVGGWSRRARKRNGGRPVV